MGSATRLRIVERNAARAPLAVADREDFTAVEPRGRLSLDEALSLGSLSLYCLDLEAHEAVFTLVPASIDLTRVPFVYQAQFEHATDLVTIALDDFLGRGEVRWREMTPPVLVYSTGRAGSTLVSRLLAEAEGVTSLSEPDVLTQLAWLRSAAMLPEDELSALARSCIALLVPAAGERRLVVKGRAPVIGIHDLVADPRGEGTALFVYRGALGVIDSFLRVLGSTPGGLCRRIEQVRWVMGLAPALADHEVASFVSLGRAGYLVAHWLGAVLQYLDVAARDPGIVALRYEDLMADTRSQLLALRDRLGLGLDDAEALGRILAADAQQGTTLARDRGDPQQGLSDAERDAIGNFLAAQPRVGSADPVLPRTLGRSTDER